MLLFSPAKSDEGKIWGDGTVVGICCCSVVRKRPARIWNQEKLVEQLQKKSRAECIPGEVVGQLARAHEHLAVLCGAVQELSSEN